MAIREKLNALIGTDVELCVNTGHAFEDMCLYAKGRLLPIFDGSGMYRVDDYENECTEDFHIDEVEMVDGSMVVLNG